MPLQLVEHTDPRLFHDAVIDRLHELGEAENSVMIGLAQRFYRQGYSPLSIDELHRPVLWTVQDGPNIDLVAIQTLKSAMLVTRGRDEAATLLADALAARDWSGQGILAPLPTIETISSRYEARSGRKRSLEVRLRTFQLERVIAPKATTGFMRQCQPGDREMLAAFLEAFFRVSNKPVEENWLDRADRTVREGRVYFWIDDQPVAMAAWSAGTRNGMRIAAVYTPPKFRGRGYASNLVASLTQQQLEQGNKFCFLNTDLANPTSNSIYQKMGYRMVSDSERWTFEAKA